MKAALVLWFTGLSGSGKTTIAKAAAGRLMAADKRVRIYDGDDVRSALTRHLTFTPEHIVENNRIVAELCLKNLSEYDYIFVPIISPFSRCRNAARELIGERFNLIYIKASIEEVIRRDSKGLYRKAMAGEISNFIGIDKNVPYESPADADLVIDSANESAEVSVNNLLNFIETKKSRELV